MQAISSAKSFEELKDLFLQHYRNGDADAMMALYYQKGASARMRNLYCASLPNRAEERIAKAQIGDVGDFDGKYWPGRDPFTLKPEKLLVLKYGKKKATRFGRYGTSVLSRTI